MTKIINSENVHFSKKKVTDLKEEGIGEGGTVLFPPGGYLGQVSQKKKKKKKKNAKANQCEKVESRRDRLSLESDFSL